MTAALLCLSLPLKPMEFPALPIAHEVREGVSIYTAGKGPERLYRDDRAVVGTWFDGKIKRDADHAIWLSPSLISRWLGYLEVKEKWEPTELPRRWSRLRQELGGCMTFIVKLCALPKIDPLEGEIVARGSLKDARSVRFLLTSSEPEWPRVPAKDGLLGWTQGKESSTERPAAALRSNPQVLPLFERQSREAKKVFVEDWWRHVPFSEALTPEFEKRHWDDGLPLGDYYAATYLLQSPLPEGTLPRLAFELRIFSPSKERIAEFSLVNGQVKPRRWRLATAR